MTQKPFVIAIDGTAASGKGTLGKRLASHLGMVHLDTGLLYRYVGCKVLREVINIESVMNHNSPEAKFAGQVASKPISLEEIVRLDLSGEAVSKAASMVSAIPAVRAGLLEFQRNVASDPKGAVLDGRDIGTVVCPDAEAKFFITASVESRAERRFKQLQALGKQVIYGDILRELKDRDARDASRKLAPMMAAKDAFKLDTTHMNMDEVFEKVLSVVLSKRA
ncbi:MAG: (d)CMP kinase [Proteobacteria bacterium]|nr:(d)CMP kinase [Pseudomonadota bacterium]